ncbi:LysR family transcriptional regulator [Paenibacillus alvei]|uniref:LysR family transcriptional regulator n=1 Tax=Paenibacillus alvei TaxID=44250 RepID=UPI0018CF9ED3|nr:LysR family transcriptional regulator [Paenibacillus alvei]MBG9736987.1 LysR family transcriptional regulator [Paenibacillus alvei]MBG9747668.1 LysR family transcriptional regulator [Paenibacillus alvei]MCY9582736.1 LysR family transcriptional regulator [Paenibacillus alvei]MCY9587455.1 LysR family transcriptional regulator [Paenibacillus alvei]
MFRQLECFIKICEEGSFAKASESLMISQPALSQQIRYIEAEFNTPVFKRAGRGIKLTAAGQILYEKAISVMRLIGESKKETAELSNTQINQLPLSIGISPLDCPNFMPFFLKFHEQHPAITLHFENIENGYRDLLHNHNHIDIVISDCPELNKELYAVQLCKEEQALFVYMDHPWADRTSISVRELKNLESDLFVRDSNIVKLLQAYDFKVIQPLQSKFHSTSAAIILSMVMQQMGVAILPISYLNSSSYSKLKVIQFLDPIPAREVKLIVRKDQFIDAAIQTFMNYFLKATKSLAV